MKTIVLACLSALVLLVFAGSVSGAGMVSKSDVNVTNVVFCQMTNVMDSYPCNPVPTFYTGTNAYGRLTFQAFDNNLTGEYALAQFTPEGLKPIQIVKITPRGNFSYDYIILKLEVNREELIVPLEFLTASAMTSSSGGNVTGAAAQSADAAVAPAATKSPVNLLTILAGLGIAGIACAMLRRT
ncbi:MAG: hypothetical protein A4E35_02193 [Methanoregula sp. PtaU1.Bin051]|nr:MAG: hypothetical protein A4E35_02193 [Methanoregula sp. PtaU1.Bin051]